MVNCAVGLFGSLGRTWDWSNNEEGEIELSQVSLLQINRASSQKRTIKAPPTIVEEASASIRNRGACREASKLWWR